jgi:uncharacterized protein
MANEKKAILITGGTGLVGRRLCSLLLQKGYTVHIFTRDAARQAAIPGVHFFNWNPAAEACDPAALQNVTAIINLAGAGVADERWTAARKQEIVNSRVQAAKTIIKALAENANVVETVINASAQGWYGADTAASITNGGFEEASFPATGFLGSTCKAWEESIKPVTELGKRLVWMRIGIVLAAEGGMIKELLKPLKFGIAPIFGNGKQVVSWIHIDDLCGMLLHAVENNGLTGAYNAAAPAPVTQKILVKTLARSRRRFFIPAPVPAFVLQLLVGEMKEEILKSVTLHTGKIRKTGYVFAYPDIESAVKKLF